MLSAQEASRLRSHNGRLAYAREQAPFVAGQHIQPAYCQRISNGSRSAYCEDHQRCAAGPRKWPIHTQERSGRRLGINAGESELRAWRHHLVLFQRRLPEHLQELLLQMLRETGVPTAICNVVRCLYHRNKCEIQLKGSRFDGFYMV